MKELPQQAYARHEVTGLILGLFAGVCFLISIVGALTPSVPPTILFAILAMIFGGFAFSHLEQAADSKPEPVPPEPPVYEIDLLSSALKSGEELSVLLALHYLNVKQSPHALTRIKVQLQTKLNVYLRMTDKLSSNPFSEIETLLNDSLAPLRNELGLEKISVQVIDVKAASAPTARSRGIYLGDVQQ
jgi:hypothetical protein